MTTINNKIKDLLIQSNDNLLTAMQIMDSKRKKLLIVFKEDKYLNVISIGDIQRAILKGIPLTNNVETILREIITLSYINEDREKIKEKMFSLRTEFMPILDLDGNLHDVIFWEDIFGKNDKIIKEKLNIPVVVMAGGKGTRLKPITNVIPKPLIPIGHKTIIEEILDRFVDVGCNEFHISINYKASTIKHYFQELNNVQYIIDYFQEEKPLGTAGSLFLIKDKIKSTFFVSNCDIIIEEDYAEILKYHRENKNELTIVSALKHYPIPYGTIETEMNGILVKLTEKPELTFQINSGFYILEPHILDEIPENTFFHITTLIENIKKRKGRVGVFPVSEGSWKDMGTWSDYLKVILP